MFNSTSSGCVLSPHEVARIHGEVPAVCAIKECLMELDPDLGRPDRRGREVVAAVARIASRLA